jgi:hypothetical protein
MSEIKQGKVYEVDESSGKVRIQSLSGRGLSSPLIDSDGRELSVGDIVSFIVFEDGSGAVVSGGSYPLSPGGGEGGFDGGDLTPISNIELENLLGA